MAKPFQRPTADEVADRIATVKALIVAGTDVASVIDWCQRQYKATPQQAAKEWVVSRQTARNYVNKAYEMLGGEDGAPKDRKRARNRAMITLIVQKLMAQNSPTALIGALKGMDQICKIDGSYDPAQLGLPGSSSTTPEDAARMIDHAHATLQLARARGVLAAPNGPPAVIDIEPDADDEPDETIDSIVIDEDPGPPSNAN